MPDRQDIQKYHYGKQKKAAAVSFSLYESDIIWAEELKIGVVASIIMHNHRRRPAATGHKHHDRKIERYFDETENINKPWIHPYRNPASGPDRRCTGRDRFLFY